MSPSEQAKNAIQAGEAATIRETTATRRASLLSVKDFMIAMPLPQISHLLFRLSLLPALLFCLLLSTTLIAQPIPADLSALLAEARPHLKSGDHAALSALATAPRNLTWHQRSSQLGQFDWKLKAVSLPVAVGQKPQYLAVFSRYHSLESTNDHFHRMVKTPSGWRFGGEIGENETLGYRVRSHDLTVLPDLPTSSCRITDTVTIERIAAKPTLCLLRLSDDFRVSAITYRGKPYPFRHTPGMIAILPPGEKQFTLTIIYEGSVTHDAYDFVTRQELLLTSYWYTHIGRLPARHQVTVTVPNSWTVIGQGNLIRKTESEGSVTCQFRMVMPVCFFSLIAGEYKVSSRTVRGRKLSVYQYSVNSAGTSVVLDERKAETALDTLAMAMTIFENRFGKYPFDHYSAVETRGRMGGALEAYTFAIFGRGALEPDTIVHELAHTWWGGIVPNTYTRSMWNESFAVYCEDLYNRQIDPTKPQRPLNGMHSAPLYGSDLLSRWLDPLSRAFDTEDGMQSDVGYGKGALVLGMLEDALGKKTLIECMRRFREEHKPGEAADWSDFERAVKRQTSLDYGWFFRQWLDRPGVPVVRFGPVSHQEREGRHLITVEILQDGKPYRVTVTLELELKDGQKLQEEVELDGSRMKVLLQSRAAPRFLRLDPGGHALLADSRIEPKRDPFLYTFPP
jgi:hypothetical protein